MFILFIYIYELVEIRFPYNYILSIYNNINVKVLIPQSIDIILILYLKKNIIGNMKNKNYNTSTAKGMLNIMNSELVHKNNNLEK